MLLPDVGGYIYAQGQAVATLGIAPLADRALMARRVNISNVSANDNWTFSVGGRELFRVRQLTVGNQQLMLLSSSRAVPELDIWEFARNVLGMDMTIPVPNGQTLTVASVGGATADIDIEASEVDIATANVKGTNHYLGNVFVVPIQWFLNASQSAAAAVQVDTQVSPAWYPAIFSDVALPVNWQVDIMAWFLEGMGVNTFSGAANHQSTTLDMRVFRDGVQMFTRAGLGIPLRGSDSAAGSANTVFGQRSGIFPAVQEQLPTDDAKLPALLSLRGGDAMQLLLDLAGDLTGGASYANALQTAICKITVPVGP